MIRAFLSLALFVVTVLPVGANGYANYCAAPVRIAVPYQPVIAVQQVYAQPVVQQYVQPVCAVRQVQAYCAAPVVQRVQQVYAQQVYAAPVVVRQVQSYAYAQQVVAYQSSVSVRAPFVRVRVGGNQGHHQGRQQGGLFERLRNRSRR